MSETEEQTIARRIAQLELWAREHRKARPEGGFSANKEANFQAMEKALRWYRSLNTTDPGEVTGPDEAFTIDAEWVHKSRNPERAGWYYAHDGCGVLSLRYFDDSNGSWWLYSNEHDVQTLVPSNLFIAWLRLPGITEGHVAATPVEVGVQCPRNYSCDWWNQACCRKADADRIDRQHCTSFKKRHVEEEKAEEETDLHDMTEDQIKRENGTAIANGLWMSLARDVEKQAKENTDLAARVKELEKKVERIDESVDYLCGEGAPDDSLAGRVKELEKEILPRRMKLVEAAHGEISTAMTRFHDRLASLETTVFSRLRRESEETILQKKMEGIRATMEARADIQCDRISSVEDSLKSLDTAVGMHFGGHKSLESDISGLQAAAVETARVLGSAKSFFDEMAAWDDICESEKQGPPIPPEAIAALQRVFTEGERESRTLDEAIMADDNVYRALNHIQGHINRSGPKGEDHIAHALARLAMAVAKREREADEKKRREEELAKGRLFVNPCGDIVYTENNRPSGDWREIQINGDAASIYPGMLLRAIVTPDGAIQIIPEYPPVTVKIHMPNEE